jgi:uncharacterized protein YhbP (UPF0306 family)
MDEPVLERDDDPQAPTTEVEGQIRELVDGQSYGVLCTQGDGQPYGSVVAYAFSQDLACFWFATPKTTRKYRLIQGCPKVALVICRQEADIMSGAAVTLTGAAAVLDSEHEQGAAKLVARHPHLESFCRAPTTAVIRLDVVRGFYVERFQEVTEWSP